MRVNSTASADGHDDDSVAAAMGDLGIANVVQEESFEHDQHSLSVLPHPSSHT